MKSPSPISAAGHSLENPRLQISDVVRRITLPRTNVYYERSSADGYAFLGYARKKLGMDPGECRKEVLRRKGSLGKAQRIRATRVPANTKYIYTMWTCAEFFRATGDAQWIQEMLLTVNRIGCYDSGMMRYCDREVWYEVPNVTSAAALLYSMGGRADLASALLQVLRRRQTDGNWRYRLLPEGATGAFEDSYHLAMMVYHLRELCRITGLDVSDMTSHAIDTLRRMNAEVLQGGTIGWGIPMLFLATVNLDSELSGRALSASLSCAICNSNFRVRALTAWALTKAFFEWGAHNDEQEASRGADNSEGPGGSTA